MELLPQIEVDFIQEEPEQLKEEVESDEDNAELTMSEQVKKEEPDSILVSVQEKPQIPEEDIFVEKKVEKPVKKKRVISEAQKERLRLGREKALANRRAKAKEKQEIKELKVKKTKKELQQLREEVEDKPKPVPFENKKTLSVEDIPPDMLIELQQRAIAGYDTQRKARKEKKKKEEEQKSIYRHTVQNAVNPAQPPKYGEAGYFNDCF